MISLTLESQTIRFGGVFCDHLSKSLCFGSNSLENRIWGFVNCIIWKLQRFSVFNICNRENSNYGLSTKREKILVFFDDVGLRVSLIRVFFFFF
jgi:hypothetical protein